MAPAIGKRFPVLFLNDEGTRATSVRDAHGNYIFDRRDDPNGNEHGTNDSPRPRLRRPRFEWITRPPQCINANVPFEVKFRLVSPHRFAYNCVIGLQQDGRHGHDLGRMSVETNEEITLEDIRIPVSGRHGLCLVFLAPEYADHPRPYHDYPVLPETEWFEVKDDDLNGDGD
ncbi:hypothetical protein VTN77DRAFT_9324 [Rasamsonia byssochlamydoides]|uniref:uncharacterized protein n=1 Tax=Rasamsonia byssochlamydoides TaxID=89139 RepID=UPI003743C838